MEQQKVPLRSKRENGTLLLFIGIGGSSYEDFMETGERSTAL